MNYEIATICCSTRYIEKIIELYNELTERGYIVLDFTMGSGTTGEACVNLNRNFIGIELEKQWFDVADKRINK